jgi:hypothetical protein
MLLASSRREGAFMRFFNNESATFLILSFHPFSASKNRRMRHAPSFYLYEYDKVAVFRNNINYIEYGPVIFSQRYCILFLRNVAAYSSPSLSRVFISMRPQSLQPLEQSGNAFDVFYVFLTQNFYNPPEYGKFFTVSTQIFG